MSGADAGIFIRALWHVTQYFVMISCCSAAVNVTPGCATRGAAGALARRAAGTAAFVRVDATDVSELTALCAVIAGREIASPATTRQRAANRLVRTIDRPHQCGFRGQFNGVLHTRRQTQDAQHGEFKLTEGESKLAAGAEPEAIPCVNGHQYRPSRDRGSWLR